MGANAQSSPSRLPSYRRRYAQIFLVLAVAFSLIAGLTYRHILSESSAGARQAMLLEQSVERLDAAFTQLYVVRHELHEFLLTPTPASNARVQTALRRLDQGLTRLAASGGTSPEDGLAGIAARLDDETETLKDVVAELIAIRHDPARWFPQTVLIEGELQDNNSLFTSHLEALIVMLGDDDVTQSVLLSLFELRKTWLRMIDELRLIIANRFGAHAADPTAGMQARQHNVGLYLEQVGRLLGTLNAEAAQHEQHDLLVAELAALDGYAAHWRRAYLRLTAQLASSDWRRDLHYLRSRVDPQLQILRSQLERLRADLHSRHRQQVDDLAHVGIQVGYLLLGAFGLLLVFGMAGYLTLDRFILRPIRALADGLKAAAGHAGDVPPRPPAVSETRDLLDAFTAMHEQVAERERELDHLAHHDGLTGLPNRALFRRRLSDAIAHARRHDQLVGLLFMDLDRFKQINDSYGHAAGDAMLTEISRRLTAVFRQDDLVARLGGDEFAVLLENIHAREEMTLLAEKALSAVERPYASGGNLFYSGASMGIAVAPDDGTDPDRLIQLADTAMYASKKEDGSSYRYVSSDMTTLAAARHALENELRSAIQHHALELHFQPVVAVDDETLHGYEALLRWPHAEQGLLRPASFMDALADAGLCGAISDWALDRLPVSQPSADAVVAINLSARLLHDEEFSQRLFERIDQRRPPPEQLILEITEDTLEADLRAAEPVLNELQRRGVRIALDDFGTGQASLSHLRRFPFDYIKIDQSFTAGIGAVPNDEKLIRAVIRLAHDLGMQVVAEGVETEVQRAFLAEQGCDYIQGYLVGKPSAGRQVLN